MLTNYADGPSAPMTCVCLGNGWVFVAGVKLHCPLQCPAGLRWMADGKAEG